MAVGAPATANAWPLVGRHAELTRIGDVLFRRGAAGVVIVGGPGVGKSRLAAEARAEAAGHGIATETAVATRAASSIPFGALAHLLPSPGHVGDRTDLLRETRAAIARRGDGQRMVIVVDDAQLLDDASAVLVHQLATTGTAALIVTVRSGEPVPDPIVALWKDELAERIELGPLSEAETDELVTAAMGGEVELATLRRLWHMTRGNALYLRELVLDARESGNLALDGDVWRWSGPSVVGARLTEVVEARLGHLASDAHRALKLLALSEPLGADVLASLVPGSLVADLETRGLVALEADGRRAVARVAHPLYGEVLRAQTGVLEGRAMRTELARAVEETGARRADDLLRVATWRLDSGGPTRPELMAEAARRANAMGDHRLAERLARVSLEGAPSFAAVLALGWALERQRRHDEAHELARPLLERAATDRERVKAAELVSQNLLFGLGRHEEAEAVLREAESAVADEMARQRLRAVRANHLLRSCHLHEALALSRPILIAPDVPEILRLSHLVPSVAALTMMGRTEQALDHVERQGEGLMARIETTPHLLGYALSAHAAALRMHGRLDDATRVATTLYELGTERGDDMARALGAVELSVLASWRGRLRTSVRWVREAIALARDQDLADLVPWGLALLAESLALLGQADEARAAMDEADALARSTVLGPRDVDLAQARAYVAHAQGEITRAWDALRVAVRAARDLGAEGVELHTLQAGLRLGAGDEVAPRILELADVVEGAWTPAVAARARGVLARDGHALDEASALFEEIGALQFAAESSAEAATAYESAGLRARASAAAARAQALSERCEAPPLTLSASAEPLTRREREIAMLAAQGLTNREIADRLVVSVRTVEGHLYQAYAKLGVKQRDALKHVVGGEAVAPAVIG